MNLSKKNSPPRVKPCLSCGSDFRRNPRYSDAQWVSTKYCQINCRQSTNVTLKCTTCRKSFTVKNYRKNCAKYCSIECRSNGVKSDGQGYLRRTGSNKRIHREVMEAHLGRELATNEVVHHVNHNKQDNRIENLQVLTRSEHIKIHRPQPDWWEETNKERMRTHV